MKPPRGLTPDEAALWARVAATVRPLRKSPPPQLSGEAAKPSPASPLPPPPPPKFRKAVARPISPPIRAVEAAPSPRPLDRGGLDGSWDRKLGQGVVQPDFTLDLHGHNLATAYELLDRRLEQALGEGARLLLLVTGKPPGPPGNGGRLNANGWTPSISRRPSAANSSEKLRSFRSQPSRAQTRVPATRNG